MAHESITDKLRAILNIKDAIKAAIISKGVEIKDSTLFEDYAQAIRSIEGGGSGGDTVEFLLNWNHQYSFNTDYINNCAAGGIMNGVMNCGKPNGYYGTSYLYKIFDNIPSTITSAKFIICASPTTHLGWDGQGCALAVWNNNDDTSKIVLQAQGGRACYWNGHTSTWNQTNVDVSLFDTGGTPFYGGTDVIWWVYEFDGNNNFMYAMRESNGAIMPSNEIYPLTHPIDAIDKVDVGVGGGINGSFIHPNTRVLIGGESKGLDDFDNMSPYAGNIDLLRCRFFINGVELERPMSILIK